MKKYKPLYLGRAIPADDQTKLTDFVQNKYDAFSKIYDSCKDESEEIDDIKVIESKDEDTGSLSIKVSADRSVLEKISNKMKEDISVKIIGDTITAR